MENMPSHNHSSSREKMDAPADHQPVSSSSMGDDEMLQTDGRSAMKKEHGSHMDHDCHSGNMEQMGHMNMDHMEHMGNMSHMGHMGHMGNLKNTFFVSLIVTIPIIFLSPMMGVSLPFQFTFPGSD